MQDELANAQALFNKHIPDNSCLTIELNKAPFGYRYLYRLTYTSPRSGRTLCVLAKGDTLPQEEGDCLLFYLRQLVLTPKELAWRFHRAYYFDRNAKRMAFLSGDRGITIIDKEGRKDYMDFEKQHLVKAD